MATWNSGHEAATQCVSSLCNCLLDMPTCYSHPVDCTEGGVGGLGDLTDPRHSSCSGCLWLTDPAQLLLGCLWAVTMGCAFFPPLPQVYRILSQDIPTLLPTELLHILTLGKEKAVSGIFASKVGGERSSSPAATSYRSMLCLMAVGST